MHGEFADRARQLMVKGDLRPVPGRTPDRRPGEAAAEGPQLRLAAGKDLLPGDADRDLEPRPGQLPRDRQRVAKGDRGPGGADALEVGERATDPAAGQGREQRAAAQGAEECSAPQARRLV